MCLAIWVISQGMASAQNDRITNTADATLAANLSFNLTNSMVPSQVNTLATTSVAFRMRDRSVAVNDPGYRLDAVLTSFTAPAASENGPSITAADIGVGITSVVPAAGAFTPRTDTIAPLFNYDPGVVPVTNGLTPYTGRGTLASLTVSARIMSGSTIGPDVKGDTPGNYVTTTIKFGLLPQYWSPGAFSATVTLTLSKGP